jgi:hypothetical protein
MLRFFCSFRDPAHRQIELLRSVVSDIAQQLHHLSTRFITSGNAPRFSSLLQAVGFTSIQCA